MRQKLAAVFLLLVMWQLIGVSSWFELSRRAVRKEIKSQIKAGVPEKDLIHFSFTYNELKKLIWIKQNEFRMNGRLYDVVYRVSHSDGKIILKCIDDIQEKVLFAKLGESTAENLGNDQQPTNLFYCVKQLFSPSEFCGFEEFNFDAGITHLSIHEFAYLIPSLCVFLEKDSPPPCAFS